MAIYKEHSLKENISTNGLFLGVLVVALSPIIFKVLGLHDNFSSVLCTVFTTGVLGLCYLTYGKKFVSSSFMWLLVINAGSLVISIVLNGSGLGVAAIHINTLLIVNILNNTTFKKEQVCLVHLLVGLYLLFWVMSLDTRLIWRSYVCDPDGQYVNPCTLAIITLASYYHLFAFADLVIKRFWMKMLLIVPLSAWALYYIYISVCRTSLLALFAFWAFCVMKRPVLGNYRKITVLLISLAFIFPAIYIVLYNTMDDWNLFGESFFTGRQVVWPSTFENILDNAFFGAGSESTIELRHGLMDDAHNLILGVWKNIGIIPVISLFVIFLRGNNIRWISINNQRTKIMFLTCFIASIAETLLNSSEFYMLFIPLLMTICSNNYNKGKNRFIR